MYNMCVRVRHKNNRRVVSRVPAITHYVYLNRIILFRERLNATEEEKTYETDDNDGRGHVDISFLTVCFKIDLTF